MKENGTECGKQKTVHHGRLILISLVLLYYQHNRYRNIRRNRFIAVLLEMCNFHCQFEVVDIQKDQRIYITL